MPWHEVIDANWKKDKMEMKIVDGKPILLGFKSMSTYEVASRMGRQSYR